MNFAAGYRYLDEGPTFSELVRECGASIGEVYFSWPGQPSGRPGRDPFTAEVPAEELREALGSELQALRAAGVKLDVLFNANCYGAVAMGTALERTLAQTLQALADLGCMPEIATAASPAVAHLLRKLAPAMELRASVNMRLGTLQAMDYASEFFDGFYLQRDFQRNLPYVRTVRQWCAAHHKKLCLLANSGCLRFCPSQTFHDNLIAHSAEVEAGGCIPDWNPHLCWTLYQNPERFVEILKATWIRPEDLHLYEGLVDVVKLATRQHAHPAQVLRAYTSGSYRGNLLDLFEPGFAPAFAPRFIDNTAFPADWPERAGACLNGCTGCGYCEAVLQKVLRRFG